MVVASIFLLFLYLNADYLVARIRAANSYLDYSLSEASPDVPLILLPGFNPVYSNRVAEVGLDPLQRAMASDLGYEDIGVLIPETPCTLLSSSEKPIIARASYFGSSPFSNMNASTANLAAIISKVKACTGADQVDVIAHSMGGIVVRDYLYQLSLLDPSVPSPVRQFVMLATPNHGGLYSVGEIANFFASHPELSGEVDFLQMSDRGSFVSNLNAGNETLSGIAYITIAGDVDSRGDGLVLADSVRLQGARNFIVPCNHLIIKHPKLCPEMYAMIKEAVTTSN